MDEQKKTGAIDPFEAFRQRKEKEAQHKKRVAEATADGVKVVSHLHKRERLRQLPPKPKGYDSGRFDD